MTSSDLPSEEASAPAKKRGRGAGNTSAKKQAAAGKSGAAKSAKSGKAASAKSTKSAKSAKSEQGAKKQSTRKSAKKPAKSKASTAAKAKQPRKKKAPRIKADAVIAKAVTQARDIVAQVVKNEYIGDHLAVVGEGDRLATHYFASLHPGYEGWAWAVTMTRVPRAKIPTVCEVHLLPWKGALLAPDWLPWEQRINPADGSNDDDDDYEATEDPRLTKARRGGDSDDKGRADLDYDWGDSPWQVDALRVNDLTLEVWDPCFLWVSESADEDSSK